MSLQSNAMIVNSQVKDENPNEIQDHNKRKISSNMIHNQFHKSHSTKPTIKAHDLWQDTRVVEGTTDTICISCKTVSIPAHSRTKSRNKQTS